MYNVIIRKEIPADYRSTETLVRNAFWNVYRPGCLEHFVLHRLRNDPAFIPELDFVMEANGTLIGQNILLRATISTDDGRTIPIFTLGPLCIAKTFQRQGYEQHP